MTAAAENASRNNNFNVLRLAAAFMVVFSHSFAVLDESQPAAFLDPFGGTWGQLGVLVFFSISGYLIAQSWQRDPSAGRYLTKRSSRIFPALVVATAFTALVVGPLTTDVGLREYFANPNTWLYPLVKSALFIPGNFDPPGIFGGSPTDGVNPSLWTLPVEFTCYVTLMIVLVVRVSPLFATGVAAVLGSALSVPSAWGGTPISGLVGNQLIHQSVLVVATFFGGSFFYFCVTRTKVRLSPVVAAVLAVVLVVASRLPWGGMLIPVIVPYVVLTVALAVPALPLGRLRGWDLSYAVYLYGFPIQQSAVYYTQTRSPLAVFFLTSAALVPLAALSWRWVERPALSWAKRAVARRRPRGGEPSEAELTSS